jgi:formate hydrogenlyase subunit 6/NADH:ubiquinone oxidoreductase subunit I
MINLFPKDALKAIFLGLKNLFKKPVTKSISYILNNRSDNFRRHFYVDNSADTGKCIGCRLCMSVCPCRAIEIIDKNNIIYKKEKCSFCGLCEKICPQKAIKFGNKNCDCNF